MVDTPYIRIEENGELVPLAGEVTTVGRGRAVDVRLDDPSVSLLHAEIMRRGPYAYVVDLGLSRNGTRVNGRPVARRVLEDGDVVSFGAARCRVGGLPREDLPTESELRRATGPELTRREGDGPGALRRRLRGPAHGPGDRRRPGGDRGRGQAAPAPAVPEVPHLRRAQPAHPPGQRGGGAGPGAAGRAARS